MHIMMIVLMRLRFSLRGVLVLVLVRAVVLDIEVAQLSPHVQMRNRYYMFGCGVRVVL